MSLSRFREIIFVLVALVVGAGSLLVAGSALADHPPTPNSHTTALFRIQQTSHGAPTPPVTVGGAGLYNGYVFPYYLTTVDNNTKAQNPEAYKLDPATAIVAPFNPKGGAFELPQGFFTSKYTDTLTPETNWPGYTTYYQYQVYNGPGRFQPNNGYASNMRMVFPTTMGNPEPNFGIGLPLIPTTTFDGRYDSSRIGSIHVEPGPNSFGGTFRMFFLPEAHFDQFITYFTPEFYYGQGVYFCRQNNKLDCTPDTFVSERGGTTQLYDAIWWHLTEFASGDLESHGPKETKATTPEGTQRTPSGNASYSIREQHYLNFIHPYTTGYAKAFNPIPVQGTGLISPRAKGYDITHSPPTTIPVVKIKYTQAFNKTLDMLTTSTYIQYTQILKGVTRVVSMVRPRLTWTMGVPLDPEDSIDNLWSPVRVAELKVYFLPEPGGMLALGVGIASLLGLSRIRRR